MANVKWSAKTQNSSPLGSDMGLIIDDPAGTPLSQRIYLGDLNLLSDGFMVNGKIDVTVASNNITVALKTKSGGNPSTTDPVSVWINGSFRRCTASVSVTKNAGTNWFSSGASELATKEVDYFVYLMWNTASTPDIIAIAFARIPYGRTYADFNGSGTDARYFAVSGAFTPTSTDECVVVGRFAATLSATASFNWSVPAFTNTNLIQHPIFHTRRLNWAPTLTGYSAAPTNTVYEYFIDRNFITCWFHEGTSGTSNSTSTTYTLPMPAVALTNAAWVSPGVGTDNGTSLTTPCRLQVSSAGSSMSAYKDYAAANWTASGGKRIAAGSLTYPIG